MYDLRPFILEVKKIVERHYLGAPGKYARWITQDEKNSRDLGWERIWVPEFMHPCC